MGWMLKHYQALRLKLYYPMFNLVQSQLSIINFAWFDLSKLNYHWLNKLSSAMIHNF